MSRNEGEGKKDGRQGIKDIDKEKGYGCSRIKGFIVQESL